MKVNFNEVYYINGRKAVKLNAFAKLVNYSDVYLLQVIKNLFRKKIYIAYKWKRNYYVFIPEKPLKNQINSPKGIPIETVETASGDELSVDWEAALNYLPTSVEESVLNFNFSFVVRDGTLYIVSSSYAELSSTLTPKNDFQFVPLNLGKFAATTDYRYGYYIFYREDRMSTFNPGTSGTLKSTQIPAAFFEVCRSLDAAENVRNGSNPGLPPRRNLSTTVSFDTGTIAVAASIPITTSIQPNGSIDIVASDYLGATGAAGIQGLKGDTGAAGIQGLKGDKGDAGATGIQGLKGDKGDAGAAGVQGLKGDKGDTGATGATGAQGTPGTVTVGAWQNLFLFANWSNYLAGYSTPQYRIYSNGLVEVKGLVKKSTALITYDTIANLPAAYAPAETMLIATYASGGTSRLQIETSGAIKVVSGNNGGVGIGFIFGLG